MSVTIQTFVNVQYNSNTYLITNDLQDPSCYLIDIGNAQDVLNALKKHQYIKAIFLTHAHYDHIAGVNEIASTFPNCKIYGSAYTIEALADSKINLSFYHWTPVIYNGNNTIILADEETLELFDTVVLNVIATPGHNAGSTTFKVGHAIFTGDSLIPQIPVVTKLKSGNKSQARTSVSKIHTVSSAATIIYPGHGKPISAGEVDWSFYF